MNSWCLGTFWQPEISLFLVLTAVDLGNGCRGAQEFFPSCVLRFFKLPLGGRNSKLQCWNHVEMKALPVVLFIGGKIVKKGSAHVYMENRK